MTINRIGDLRRVAGLRHRFDTEHPTLLDLELINNSSREKSKASSKSGTAAGNGGVKPSSVAPTDRYSSPLPRNVARPQFGLRWKMFELDGCSGNGRVCLVFPPKPDPPPPLDGGDGSGGGGLIRLDLTPPTPQVWYLDRAYDWHFLAPTFTAYFRMMLVHLGLPQWQALFTPFGPTPWAKVSVNMSQSKLKYATR